MRTIARQSGPFEETLYFRPQEIDEMCLEALRVSGFLPSSPEPVNIERFVEKHFQCLIGYEDLPSGVLGYTAFSKTGKVIAVGVSSKIEEGTEISERRIRSTWAHEAGHCLMHAVLFMEMGSQNSLGLTGQQPSNIIKDRILCRHEHIDASAKKSYNGLWWEWQANRAITAFLLPRHLVRKAIESSLVNASVTNSPKLPAERRRDVELAVAKVFEVNPVVARIRLGEMFPNNDAQLEF